jgi:catechol 2,3-dioxygenase-like lactoylglutathione lyase family enzyme
VTTATTPITHAAIVFIYVSDQDEALRFYTEKLGFEVRSDVAYDGELRWLEVVPPGERTGFALLRPHHPDHPEPGSRVEVSFACEDAAASHAELAARGVRVGEVAGGDGPTPPWFFAYDQDGNRLMLVERA